MEQERAVQKSGSRFSAPNWLRQPRVWGRCLFVLCCLATLIGLIYLVENWRGNRAWTQVQKQMEARGLSLVWEAYVPPLVEDEQNFAEAGFFQPLFDAGTTYQFRHRIGATWHRARLEPRE